MPFLRESYICHERFLHIFPRCCFENVKFPPFFSSESLTAINSVEEMLLTYYDLRSAPTQAALAKMESFASSSEVDFPQNR